MARANATSNDVQPSTPRGIRTRNRVIAAARWVFERDGYIDARVADITARAKCSTGTFYLYFADKADVFNAVLEQAQEDMYHPAPNHVGGLSPYEQIHASNRAYLDAFARNAGLMRLLEQVATFDPDVREFRRQRALTFVHRNARAIARLQERGLADPTLDANHAAWALSAMVSRTAYYRFCLNESEIAIDVLVETCTRLWANALGLKTPDGAPA